MYKSSDWVLYPTNWTEIRVQTKIPLVIGPRKLWSWQSSHLIKQSVALVFGLKFPESQGVPLFLNLEYNYLDA